LRAVIYLLSSEATKAALDAIVTDLLDGVTVLGGARSIPLVSLAWSRA
jgi:hypothetical protein